MPADQTALRLTRFLTAYRTRNPRAWQLFEHVHLHRAGLEQWPAWCYVPVAAAVSNPAVVRLEDAGIIAALAAWRTGQGVYRFDPDLLTELWRTPVTGNIPGELLLRMPEWCVYLEAPPDTRVSGAIIHGAFAHLDWTPGSQAQELRLVLDLEPSPPTPTLLAVPLPLGGTLEDALGSLTESSRRIARDLTADPGARAAIEARVGGTLPAPTEMAEHMAFLKPVLEPFISCLLFICSVAGEYLPPTAPKVTTTKKGPRMFPADRVTIRDVGVVLGSRLQAARIRAEASSSSLKGKGEPLGFHLRRAHWSTFWYGPKTGDTPQRPEARWLLPILVNADQEGPHPVVIHPVMRD